MENMVQFFWMTISSGKWRQVTLRTGPFDVRAPIQVVTWNNRDPVLGCTWKITPRYLEVWSITIVVHPWDDTHLFTMGTYDRLRSPSNSLLKEHQSWRVRDL